MASTKKRCACPLKHDHAPSKCERDGSHVVVIGGDYPNKPKQVLVCEECAEKIAK